MFNLNKFSPIGGQSTRGASPQVYSYVTTDSKATVEGVGYFNGAKNYLEANDLICCILPTALAIYKISLVPINGNVAIENKFVTSELTTTDLTTTNLITTDLTTSDAIINTLRVYDSLHFGDTGRGEAWKDINIGGIQLALAASSKPDLINLDTTNIQVYAFDGGSTMEQAFGSFELQHDYVQGTDISPHVHFYPTTTAVGNIKWFLEYYIRIGNTIKLTDTLTCIKASGGVAWEELRCDFPDIVGTTLSIGAQIHFRLYRNPSDEQDTYGADVALATFGIHYKSDGLGSDSKLVKSF